MGGQEDTQIDNPDLQRPSVFLSYRRLDDEIPPGERKGAGFARYLQDPLSSPANWRMSCLLRRRAKAIDRSSLH
jgi:hypothetical protein